ncbi:MAG: patatin family protein [Clostridia bacterium]|nr:patatin family protein [Clostridia bacterium]
MAALILEGGTFRPVFSCGIMDALMDNDINFDYVIGVSAGISHGFSYVSKQRGRAYTIVKNHRHDKRYIGIRNYFLDRSLFGLKFAYETVGNELYPFDWEAFRENPAKILVGVTNAHTGEIEYLDGKKTDSSFNMLKATCALPLAFPAITVGENEYFDGGITDSIPAKKAYEDGNEKMLIILTRTDDYVKTLSVGVKVAAKLFKRKYPKVSDALLRRHKMYNDQIDYCKKLEDEDKAIILRPSEEVQIDSFEKDLDKMERVYRYGYNLAIQNLDKIKELF